MCCSFGVAGLGCYPCGRLQPATRIPPQPSHTETPIHIKTRTHNQCGDTIAKSQAPDDGFINLLTPNDDYSGRTAPLTSKRCILYIFSSTNTGTEYFKHCIYSPVLASSKCSLFHKSNIFGCFIIHILYTECAKIKKIISAPKG